MLRPFFTFFGSKWRLAPKYPAPKHETIIEPFAGSAGYAHRFPERNIILYDKDPVLAGLWRYLVKVTEEEVRALPTEFSHVDELKVCEEAKYLIGFWLNRTCVRPRKQPVAWAKDPRWSSCHWGTVIRERVASQLKHIRHWKVVEGSYDSAPNDKATWFVDPPYVEAGKFYRYREMDYEALAAWCQKRKGQVIVCEEEGADWLPFQPFEVSPGRVRAKKKSAGVVWLKGC